MITWYELGFPMGRDFLVPQDKGTEVQSLSQEKGTTGWKSLHCPRTKGQQDYHKLGRNLTFCLRMGQDGRGLKTEGKKEQKKYFFDNFWICFACQVVILSWDIPGFLLHPLFQDKGTTEQGNFLILWKGTMMGHPVFLVNHNILFVYWKNWRQEKMLLRLTDL